MGYSTSRTSSMRRPVSSCGLYNAGSLINEPDTTLTRLSLRDAVDVVMRRTALDRGSGKKNYHDYDVIITINTSRCLFLILTAIFLSSTSKNSASTSISSSRTGFFLATTLGTDSASDIAAIFFLIGCGVSFIGSFATNFELDGTECSFGAVDGDGLDEDACYIITGIRQPTCFFSCARSGVDADGCFLRAAGDALAA